MILLAILFLFSLFLFPTYSYSAQGTKSGGKYYTESKKYIMLKMSSDLEAYVNKKNQKVYYLYAKRYYTWNEGIWFNSRKINGIYKITPQDDIPAPLKHGPLLRVKRKKAPAGFAAVKLPPSAVSSKLPYAVTRHLYDFPLTLHGLIIYQRKFNISGP